MATKDLFGFYYFGTFMCNKILDMVSKFQGKITSCL